MNRSRLLAALVLPFLAGFQGAPTTAPALGPTPARADIPYKDGADLTPYERDRCKLDLYLPSAERPAAGYPVVVWFYGGALEGGEKSGERRGGTLKAMLGGGVAFVAVNYRLSPKATYPAYVDDAAAATAYVVHHAAELGLDPAKVFVSGHSAGGYLSAAIAYDEKFLAKYGAKTTDLAGTIPISPQVFTHYTIRKERGIPDSGLTPVIDDAAPAYHARKDAPPTLIFWGSNDLITRPQECAYFIKLLEAKKHPDARGLEVEGRDHGSIVGHMTDPSDPVSSGMLAFIRSHASAPAPK